MYVSPKDILLSDNFEGKHFSEGSLVQVRKALARVLETKRELRPETVFNDVCVTGDGTYTVFYKYLPGVGGSDTIGLVRVVKKK